MAKRKPTRDIYQEVTDRILEFLDAGDLPPWRKPILGKGADGIPKNLASGKAYRGINIFLLAMTSWAMGYESSYWLTYKQCQSLGGQVRRGEKSSLVTFWKTYEKHDRETDETTVLPVLRHYSAFNVEQCEGITAPDQVATADLIEFTPIEAAQGIVDGYCDAPPIVYGGGKACYLPRRDEIEIARPERFVSGEDYYATLFHELAHSTGHEKRLNRHQAEEFEGHVFGSPAYGREELVAEFASAILCGHARISPPTIENAAAYIDSWRRKIQADKRLVVQAAGRAQAAVDYILGSTFEEAANPSGVPSLSPRAPPGEIAQASPTVSPS